MKFKMQFFDILLLSVLCLTHAPLQTRAQPITFGTCGALEFDLDIPFLSDAPQSVRELCAASTPSAPEFDSTVEASGTVTTSLAISSSFRGAPTLSASARSVVEEGSELTVEAPSTPETAVRSSSFGGVPFTVAGGDPPDVRRAQRFGSSLRRRSRPTGIWFTISAVDVTQSTASVWSAIRDLGDFLTISLRGIGATVRPLGEDSFRIELNNGESLTLDLGSTNQRSRYLTFSITEVSSRVFPGFNAEGTTAFVQVHRTGFSRSRANIEIGWGVLDRASVPDNLRVGVKLVESLILEMLKNLEARFGQTCEVGRNLRTIEGDCNNLNDPPRASAGSPLRRLGGLDPAYPLRDRTQPSGAVEINAREISNKLFAMSPGFTILENNAGELDACFETTEESRQRWTLCPLEQATREDPTPQLSVPFKDFKKNDCDELIFVYASTSCRIEVLFKCSGEARLDFANNPCGAKTNRFFHPLACTRMPAEDSVLANSDGLTDLFFTFAQFIDHDLGLTPVSQISRNQPGFSRLSRPQLVDEFPIEIPEEDFHFPDKEEFPFERSRFSDEDELSHVNQHSSYLDASQLYGMTALRARLLREFSGGRLSLTEEDLPPFNKISGTNALRAVVENGPNTDGKFFVVGDPRGNEQPLLLSLHIVFLREHNLIADELAELFPNFDDERLYQTARAIVIAEYQSIIYNEWLPRLLGPSAPSAAASYRSRIDATVSTIFTTAAFRFGHTMVGTNLLKMGAGSRSSAQMDLVSIRDLFFEPDQISGSGLEEFLRGGAWHAAKEVDHKVVDELRNFLLTGEGFDVGRPLVFDLVALNIQRARDMGLPTYNNVRRLFRLRPFRRFSDFISDPNLADLASEVYEGDVDNVDLFFGGLVEDHVSGSQFGETFHRIISDQFTRLRDGDRFFYTEIQFDDELISSVPRLKDIIRGRVRLGDIIVRATGVATSELGTKPSVFQI